MNYYGAREQLNEEGKPSGLFYYTCRNNEFIWPVGYCADNCPGHKTREEAAEHYRQYQLDHFRYDGREMDAQRKCQVCEVWTQGYAYLAGGYQQYVLCDQHRNRVELDKLVKKPSQIISSQ